MVKRYAVIKNGLVTNVMLLEETLSPTFPVDGELVEVQGTQSAYIGGDYNGTRLMSKRFGNAPTLDPLRVDILSEKIDDDTATLPEIREYLKLSRGGG
jgi:hypothetical protein